MIFFNGNICANAEGWPCNSNEQALMLNTVHCYHTTNSPQARPIHTLVWTYGKWGKIYANAHLGVPHCATPSTPPIDPPPLSPVTDCLHTQYCCPPDGYPPKCFFLFFFSYKINKHIDVDQWACGVVWFCWYGLGARRWMGNWGFEDGYLFVLAKLMVSGQVWMGNEGLALW